MRPYILAENNWKTIKETKYEVAILPWGACEAHNYHLPYGTDIIEADNVAAESARIAWEQGSKVIVLPTVPFGVNTGQFDVALDINMNPSTQLADFTRFFFGGHGANEPCAEPAVVHTNYENHRMMSLRP